MASQLAKRWREVLLACVTGVVLVVGWKAFWFLCDDAFIAFRYASNSLEGRGLVWNPAPFVAVEGYTSFSWVVLLREVWRFTGIAPPDAANWLSLGCAGLSLFIGYRFVARMMLPTRWTPHRLLLAAFVLLGVTSNRTFLAWTSSGLETALFNVAFLWWLYLAVAAPAQRTPRWTAWLASAATLTALTRPDGLLLVASTLLIVAWECKNEKCWLARTLHASPLLLVGAHVLWRKSYYGHWLPNTYYAKYTVPWPESGVRYLASFALEYGLYVWAMVVAAAIWAMRSHLSRGLLGRSMPAVLAIGTVLGHVGYYTLLIGGDHFEYRVYSHLIIPVFVCLLWLVTRTEWRRRSATAALLSVLLCSLPIPWTHWAATKGIVSRKDTYTLIVPIADRVPPPFGWVAAPFDNLQSWLISHYVGMRHQEHKAFWLHQERLLPERDEGEDIGWALRPILPEDTVGVVGWVLPNVAIIDTLGLNDRVIAHSRIPAASGVRWMAHERHAPPNYVACFDPNVTFRPGWLGGTRLRAAIRQRDTPFDDDTIRRCETTFWGRPQTTP